MAFETTWNCDLCGTIGGGAQNREMAKAEARAEGWFLFYVPLRDCCVCPVCVEQRGGKETARAEVVKILGRKVD